MQHRVTALFAIVALGASIAAWSNCSVVRKIQIQPGSCQAHYVAAQPNDPAHWAVDCSADSIKKDGGCDPSSTATTKCYPAPAKKTINRINNAQGCSAVTDSNGNVTGATGTCTAMSPAITQTVNCHYGYQSSNSCLGVSDTALPAN